MYVNIFTGKLTLPDTAADTETSSPHTCQALTDANFPLLAEYDRTIYPADRSKLLRVFLNHPPARQTLMAVTNDNKCVGYVCVRQTNDNKVKLRPFVADDVAIADLLLTTAIKMKALEGKITAVDVPDVNSATGRALFARYGVTQQRAIVTRMCTKPDVHVAHHMTVPLSKIYSAFFGNLLCY